MIYALNQYMMITAVIIILQKRINGDVNMEQTRNIDTLRFDDRREYNEGPPDKAEERRTINRRDNDQYRADIKTVLDMSIQETVTDEEVGNILKPVLEDIKAGKYN